MLFDIEIDDLWSVTEFGFSKTDVRQVLYKKIYLEEHL